MTRMRNKNTIANIDGLRSVLIAPAITPVRTKTMQEAHDATVNVHWSILGLLANRKIRGYRRFTERVAGGTDAHDSFGDGSHLSLLLRRCQGGLHPYIRIPSSTRRMFSFFLFILYMTFFLFGEGHPEGGLDQFRSENDPSRSQSGNLSYLISHAGEWKWAFVWRKRIPLYVANPILH